MKKKNVLWIILDLIFLIVFNTVFFVLGGTDHSASVWICYGFIHLSYIMLLITPMLVRNSSSRHIFGVTLASISSTYFLVTFVLGLIIILFDPASYKITLVVHVIIAGIYAIILVSNMIANEATADSLEVHEQELVFVKTCSMKLNGIVESVSDKQLRKKIERAYDVVHASPVKSSPRVKPLEEQINDIIDALANDVKAGNTERAAGKADRIVSLTEERNRQLKYSN